MLADASSAHVVSLLQCAKHGGCERACSVNCELTSITFSRVACRRDFGELQRRSQHGLVHAGAHRVIELAISAALHLLIAYAHMLLLSAVHKLTHVVCLCSRAAVQSK